MAAATAAVRFALVLAVTLVAAAKVHAETVYFDYDAYPPLARAMAPADGTEPTVFTQDRAPVYVLTRVVVEGASAQDWSESLDITDTRRRDAPRTVARWYEEFRATGETSCPSEWTVLAEDKASMTFERVSGDCPPHVAQHALYRVLYGRSEVFTLVATRKGSMDEATREAWLKVLGSANLKLKP